MKIKKKKLSVFKSPYSVYFGEFNGETVIFSGSESIDGDLYIYSGRDYKPIKISKGPGGFMGMFLLGSSDSYSLVTAEGLHTNFQSVNPGISIYYPEKDINHTWKRQRIVDLAYIHRISHVSANEKKNVIAATLCGKKDNIDDWSSPGAVYAIQLQNDRSGKVLEKTLLLDGITKNHGMYVKRGANLEIVFISGDEGIFALHVPKQDNEWRIDKIIEQSVSELVVKDLDGDGEDEIAAIQPFHGDRLCIYKKINGKWEIVGETKTEFGHGIWAGRIVGKNSIILGSRGGKRNLCLYTIEDTVSWKLNKTVIDEGTGTAQIDVVRANDTDFIAASNGYIDEVALYEVVE
jgi:hypothetical protein